MVPKKRNYERVKLVSEYACQASGVESNLPVCIFFITLLFNLFYIQTSEIYIYFLYLQRSFIQVLCFCTKFFIVQHIDVDFRSMCCIKIYNIIITSSLSPESAV